MRPRSAPNLVFSVATAAALAALTLAGCSSPSGSDEAARTSPPRPTTTLERTPKSQGGSSNGGAEEGGSADPGGSDQGTGNSGNGNQGNGGSGNGSSGDKGSAQDDMGLDDLAGGLAQVGDCMELVGKAFGALAGADSAEEYADALKSKLPEDLHDDVDVVVDAMKQVAEGDPNSTDALDTPEYRAAEEAITDYLAKTCGLGSSGEGT